MTEKIQKLNHPNWFLEIQKANKKIKEYKKELKRLEREYIKKYGKLPVNKDNK